MTAIAPETIISFRFLEPDEHSLVEDIFKENGGALPLPSVSKIAVAENEATHEIVGFYTFQLVPHAEPMWIHPDYRASGVWVKLVEMILPLTEVRETYIIATTPQTIAMCDKLGLERVRHPVYVKKVV